MPLAGAQPTYPQAAGVNDAFRKKYTYFLDDQNLDPQTNNVTADGPAPLSAALGKYMNLSVDLTSRKKLQASLLQEAVYRAFTCANDINRNATVSTINYSYSGSKYGPLEVMSYLFNGAVLSMGHDGTNLNRAPAGKLSRIRRPAEVFLFCDGKPGQDLMRGYEVYCFADYSETGTLYDYWVRGGGGPDGGPECAKFDYTRHRQKMNVAFVDGHVEPVELPSYVGGSAVLEKTGMDFKRVGVSKGVYQ
jgi:prepilin-type processing-associated H-X9-DG protein